MGIYDQRNIWREISRKYGAFLRHCTKFSLLDYFDDYPEEKEKLLKVWTNLTAIDAFLAKKFPKLFKNENLTRKDIDLAIVLPKQIRELKIANLMLRLEEKGENSKGTDKTLFQKTPNPRKSRDESSKLYN